MRVEVNKCGKIDVFTDKADLCFSCSNKTDCPLVEALRAEVVVLHYSEIDVLKCGMFSKQRKCNE